LNTSPPAFDLNCGAARPNARFIVHPYIMGFRFNPTGGLHTLGASVLLGDGSGTNVASVDEALVSANFILNPAGPSSTPSGPTFTVKAFSNQLRYIKIAIVITTILDLSNYPQTSNSAPFVYSGVYMRYTMFNNPKPLVQETTVQNNFAGRIIANIANK
jgi:hypothetical protein